MTSIFLMKKTGTIDLLVFLLALTVVTLLKQNEILKNNARAKHFINALFIAALLVPFTRKPCNHAGHPILLTIHYVIGARSYLLFRKRRIFVYFVACSTLIVLLIRNNPTYIFWQQ